MIEVKLWGETLGVVQYDPKKRESRFAFNPAFDQKKLNVAPILMPYDPEHNGEYGIFSEAKDPFYEGLPPMIADSLPDDFGNDVLKNWLRQNNEDADNLSPSLKLSYIGKRGLGALEYYPQLTKETSSPLGIDLRELSEISNRITETNLLPKEITRSTMKEMFMVGTSAGGARPKAVVSINFNTTQILYSNTPMEGFVPVIIKFDKPVEETGESTEIGKIEYIYHKMAEMAEITMSPCGLFKENGLQHFYTHRFDRDEKGEKLHMQTLAGLAGMNPRHSHDYDDVFRILIALNLPYSDFEQQFRRMVFNYVTSNDDCHTKNISFLMDSKGEWRLSPAYDLTFPYHVNKVWKKPHPISINAKTKNVSLDDMYSVGKEFGIKNPHRIVSQVLEVSSHWSQLADRYKLDRNKAVEIYKYFVKQ